MRDYEARRLKNTIQRRRKTNEEKESGKDVDSKEEDV
jgi:hypothetical protein